MYLVGTHGQSSTVACCAESQVSVASPVTARRRWSQQGARFELALTVSQVGKPMRKTLAGAIAVLRAPKCEHGNSRLQIWLPVDRSREQCLP